MHLDLYLIEHCNVVIWLCLVKNLLNRFIGFPECVLVNKHVGISRSHLISIVIRFAGRYFKMWVILMVSFLPPISSTHVYKYTFCENVNTLKDKSSVVQILAAAQSKRAALKWL